MSTPTSRVQRTSPDNITAATSQAGRCGTRIMNRQVQVYLALVSGLIITGAKWATNLIADSQVATGLQPAPLLVPGQAISRAAPFAAGILPARDLWRAYRSVRHGRIQQPAVTLVNIPCLAGYQALALSASTGRMAMFVLTNLQKEVVA